MIDDREEQDSEYAERTEDALFAAAARERRGECDWPLLLLNWDDLCEMEECFGLDSPFQPSVDRERIRAIFERQGAEISDKQLDAFIASSLDAAESQVGSTPSGPP